MGSPWSGGQWVVRGAGVSLFNSPSLRSYIKHLKEWFHQNLNTLKSIKKNLAASGFFNPFLGVLIS